MIDIHSHILPGLDDGPAESAASLAMIRMAAADGIRVMVATPHMLPDGPMANRREVVMEGVENLRRAIQEAGIPMEVHPGGEIYIGPHVPEELAQRSLLTCADRGVYALIELPVGEIPSYAEQVFYDCQLRSVSPIVAHPERYARGEADLTRMVAWIERGIYLQVNARSLLGESGPRVQRTAQEMVTSRLAHIVASDCHSPTRRPPGLKDARDLVESLTDVEYARFLFEENPRRAVAGEPIKTWEPALPVRRGLLGRLLRRSG